MNIINNLIDDHLPDAIENKINSGWAKVFGETEHSIQYPAKNDLDISAKIKNIFNSTIEFIKNLFSCLLDYFLDSDREEISECLVDSVFTSVFCSSDEQLEHSAPESSPDLFNEAQKEIFLIVKERLKKEIQKASRELDTENGSVLEWFYKKTKKLSKSNEIVSAIKYLAYLKAIEMSRPNMKDSIKELLYHAKKSLKDLIVIYIPTARMA